MAERYFLSSSCGNDSVAMMVKAANDGLAEDTVVVYGHTGWASKKWADRIEMIRSFAEGNGFVFIEINKNGLTLPQLMIDRKGFPMPGRTWCSLHLKALPFLAWADAVDPYCKAVVMIGKRRDESFARRETPEWIASSENHGGRAVWHPLAYVTEAQRDELLLGAGFDVLPHRSGECTPCVNANRSDMVHMEQEDIDKTIALEGDVGQNMFRPYHHMGATGFAQVIKWAHSPRGKYEPPEVASTCTEGYCE